MSGITYIGLNHLPLYRLNSSKAEGYLFYTALASLSLLAVFSTGIIGEGHYYYFFAMAQPQPPQFQPQQQQPFQPQQPFTPSPSPTPSPPQPGELAPTQPQQPFIIDPQNVQFLTYENGEARIKVDYPAHWQQVSVPPPDVVGFHNPQTSSVVAVAVFPVQPGTTLEQTIPIKIDRFSSFFPNFQLLGSTPEIIDGKNGHAIAYSYTTDQGDPLTAAYFWTISNNVEYGMRYVALSDQFYSELALADQMMQSFDILDSLF